MGWVSFHHDSNYNQRIINTMPTCPFNCLSAHCACVLRVLSAESQLKAKDAEIEKYKKYLNKAKKGVYLQPLPQHSELHAVKNVLR